jgi:betaine-aldehyde dehydrogenase
MEADDSSLPIVQHETFGPVPILQTFDSEDEAVALANDTDYDLSACIWSRDVDSQRPLRLWLGPRAMLTTLPSEIRST